MQKGAQLSLYGTQSLQMAERLQDSAQIERMKSSGDCVWVDTQNQFPSQLTNPQGEMAAAQLSSGMIQPSYSLQPPPSAPRDPVCPAVRTL